MALGDYLPLISETGLVVALSVRDRNLVLKWLSRVEENKRMTWHVHDAMAGLIDDRDNSLNWLRNIYEMNQSPEISDVISMWAAYHGDPELALSAMRRSNNSWPTLWMPHYSEVRRLQGFKDFVRDKGLVEYWREFGWGDYCHPIDEDDFECE